MAMTTAKRVYDFKVEPVKSNLVKTFKRRKNESTIADLIAVTGLPKYQVEQTTKVILDEYGGHCKVTESGEILYYFPHGMRSRINGFLPGLKKFFKGFFSVAAKILVFLFKIWIMVMLVGYFIIFLAVLVLALVAAIAASASSRSGSRSRSRGGSVGLFFLVMRLLEIFIRVFFWVSITRQPKKRTGRPFYKSVFGYVFGDVNPNADWEEKERIRVLAYIRSQKGVITPTEFMSFTGLDYDAAQEAISSYLVEFEGEPMVTDDGTLFYFFPELLRTRKEDLLMQGTVTVGEATYKELVPFSTNKTKTNVAITFFNSFNLFFGSYFTIFAALGLSQPGFNEAAESGFGIFYFFLHDFLDKMVLINGPAMGILIGLGIIPLSFSFFFFLVPIIRKLRLRKENEKIRRENLRKKLFCALYYNPVGFNPASIRPSSDTDNPRNAGKLVEQEIDRFAGVKQADVEKTDDGGILYHFPELEREIAAIAAYRNTIDLKKYEVGETVFDTNE